MSNLNFESFENKSPKTTSSKSSKKPAKKKQKPPMGIIIGVGIVVVLGIIFLFSGGRPNSSSGNKQSAQTPSLSKSEETMESRHVEASQTVEVPDTHSGKNESAQTPSLPKPDETMKRRLVETSRTMEVPATEIWKFYCNHDPEGYLRYLDDQCGEEGLSGKLTILTTGGRNNDQVDDLTAMALFEIYKTHKQFPSPFWKSFKGDIQWYASYFYTYEERLRRIDIYWTGEEF
ncbi:MAG: hypothetical protein IJQ31_11170 [Thermoguttaceae bacterium]|nr:hypothetical protein [Thermoguttaceae bacterium]